MTARCATPVGTGTCQREQGHVGECQQERVWRIGTMTAEPQAASEASEIELAAVVREFGQFKNEQREARSQWYAERSALQARIAAQDRVIEALRSFDNILAEFGFETPSYLAESYQATHDALAALDRGDTAQHQQQG